MGRDPGQLPPVKAKGTELLTKPTHKLTEIHRQAADNPIIKLAYAVRRGAALTYRSKASTTLKCAVEAQISSPRT